MKIIFLIILSYNVLATPSLPEPNEIIVYKGKCYTNKNDKIVSVKCPKRIIKEYGLEKNNK